MVILDGDLGDNARYALSLRDVHNSQGLFSVHPTSGQGRTPVVVRVRSRQGLDYDVDDPTLRRIEFDVVVHAKGDTVSAGCEAGRVLHRASVPRCLRAAHG